MRERDECNATAPRSKRSMSYTFRNHRVLLGAPRPASACRTLLRSVRLGRVCRHNNRTAAGGISCEGHISVPSEGHDCNSVRIYYPVFNRYLHSSFAIISLCTVCVCCTIYYLQFCTVYPYRLIFCAQSACVQQAWNCPIEILRPVCPRDDAGRGAWESS